MTENTNSLALLSYDVKSMWNTMECKRDGFSGALGGARETHWECVSHALKITSHFYWISKSFRNYPKLPKYWAIQLLRGNKYNCPMLDQLLRHRKCAFLYIYDGAIFDDLHGSKLVSIWLGSNAQVFDGTFFSFMNHSKPYIYSDAAWYNNCEITPNLMHLQWSNIFSYFAFWEDCTLLFSSKKNYV